MESICEKSPEKHVNMMRLKYFNLQDDDRMLFDPEAVVLIFESSLDIHERPKYHPGTAVFVANIATETKPLNNVLILDKPVIAPEEAINRQFASEMDQLIKQSSGFDEC
ncbi:hypothetical protein AVEN_27609-1 [Araneus ventricosus]|uniref:Uncharacterized protein n=1 Tax=Araneus ventricosus TaxID=182803 RepID=A0A4Y2ENY6_ARAVE|nr:hypothetical protein AVEN_27609-1 [Araneus ventricosus]